MPASCSGGMARSCASEGCGFAGMTTAAGGKCARYLMRGTETADDQSQDGQPQRGTVRSLAGFGGTVATRALLFALRFRAIADAILG